MSLDDYTPLLRAAGYWLAWATAGALVGIIVVVIAQAIA